jgi:RimJ/RimL family protein N-acetyltransferase
MAESWIATHASLWDRGSGVVWAVVRRQDDRLIGACGLTIERDHDRAELGYWIGKPYWGNGYATEAAAALVRYAFASGLNRVMARHFRGNVASGRVMQKIGMRQEGVMRQHIRRWGQLEDIVIYAVLAGDTP